MASKIDSHYLPENHDNNTLLYPQRDLRHALWLIMLTILCTVVVGLLVIFVHRFVLGEAIADSTGNCSWYVFESQPEGEATTFDSDPYERMFSCGEQNEQIGLDVGEARSIELPGTDCAMRLRYADSPTESERVIVRIQGRAQNGELNSSYCVLNVAENGEGGDNYKDTWYSWPFNYYERKYTIYDEYVDNGIVARLCEFRTGTWRDTPCYTVTIEV